MLASMTESRNWGEVARLVVEAQAGEADAFRELLVSHRAAVSSTLIACGVRSEDTARDLAQEVALRAWRRLSTLEDPRSFTAWIRRIAANAARDHLRRIAVRREEELEQALELAGDDDPYAEAERRSELRLMLAALEDEDAEVVELLVARADGTSVEALALRTGLSEGALKMRLMRARKRLRERLEELRRS
jgi:RNA polymerase sigma-70 factor (ECF subfamily)